LIGQHEKLGIETVLIRNDDVLLTLRVYSADGDTFPTFSAEQAIIRDAFDALQVFFARIELALRSRLIDVEPSRKYFRYWVERFVTMDRHPDNRNVLNGLTPAQAIAYFISRHTVIPTRCGICVVCSRSKRAWMDSPYRKPEPALRNLGPVRLPNLVG
jgi:hypothetical protein